MSVECRKTVSNFQNMHDDRFNIGLSGNSEQMSILNKQGRPPINVLSQGLPKKFNPI